MTKGFKDLVVWQKVIELSMAIYQLTSSFPDAERFGLVNQMRRASVSIPSNIAEGMRVQAKESTFYFSATRAALAPNLKHSW